MAVGRNGLRRRRTLVALGTTLFLALATMTVPLIAGSASAKLAAVATTDPSCLSAGATGLTAKIVAHNGQWIGYRYVNATGCDIGIYVGPGVHDVTIVHDYVTGANDHGIFVQDTGGVSIRDNGVVHNGLAPNKCGTPPCIAEDKAIELSGTHGVVVQGNLVEDNFADGGIGVSDDGPIDPGAPSSGTLHAGTWNVVSGNQIIDDAFGCGIVVAAYDAGAGVAHNLVRGNVIIGSGPGTGPFVGGIVVAADTPGTFAWDNTVAHNRIYSSLIPGIVVHSNAPGDKVWNNTLRSNQISNNGFEGPPNDPTVPTGIEVVAEAAPGEPNAPTLANTTVLYDTINNNAIGVWLCNEANTQIVGLQGYTPVSVESC